MKRIYLIGPRGSGKSTLGKSLARALNYTFLDTDEEIIKKEKKNIGQIVVDKGWEYFRDLETTVLYSTSNLTKVVVATGGGIVLREQNRRFLQKEPFVFFLKVSSKEAIKRLKSKAEKQNRPALTHLSWEEEIKKIIKEREKFYVDCAKKIVEGDKSIKFLLEEIWEILKVKE